MNAKSHLVESVRLPPRPFELTVAGPALLVALHPLLLLDGSQSELAALSLVRVARGSSVRLRALEAWGGCLLKLQEPPESAARPSTPQAAPADAIAASTAQVAAAWLAGEDMLERSVAALWQRLRYETAVNPARRRSGQLEELKSRVEARMHRPPSLARAADEVELHPVYLARVFRARYGCSLCTYQHRRRIDQAAASLAHRRHQNLAALASELGFSDQSHFTRIFRRHVGVAPAAFARLLQSAWRLSPPSAPPSIAAIQPVHAAL